MKKKDVVSVQERGVKGRLHYVVPFQALQDKAFRERIRNIALMPVNKRRIEIGRRPGRVVGKAQ